MGKANDLMAVALKKLQIADHMLYLVYLHTFSRTASIAKTLPLATVLPLGF